MMVLAFIEESECTSALNEFAYITRRIITARCVFYAVAVSIFLCVVSCSLYNSEVDGAVQEELHPVKLVMEPTYEVYVTTAGKKYHERFCSYLSLNTRKRTTKAEAESNGYEPCKICIGEE